MKESNTKNQSDAKRLGNEDKKHPLYKRWYGMVNRCTNPNSSDWFMYGWRGITVCDRWRFGEGGKTGLQCFADDVGLPPKGHTLDRINGAGNYEPDNCRWASYSMQNRNRMRPCPGIEACAAAIRHNDLGEEFKLSPKQWQAYERIIATGSAIPNDNATIPYNGRWVLRKTAFSNVVE